MRIFESLVTGMAVLFVLFIPFPASGADPDSFEPDDSLEQARSIFMDEPQQHNFHGVNDVDWVKFYGLKGENYGFEVYAAGTECDPALELLDKNGVMIKEEDENFEGVGEIFYWNECVLDSVYYIRVRNVSTTGFGDDAGYTLKVWKPSALDAQIYGIVSDKHTSLPLADVRVRTSGQETAISRNVDNIGFYRIPHTDGEWDVYAYADGYKRFFETFTLGVAEIKEYDIAMSPVDLADVIEVLKVVAGTGEAGTVDFRNDLSGDDRMGVAEAVYYIQIIAEIR